MAAMTDTLPTARECLRLWCSRRGRIAELARETGASTSSVHRWLNGTLPQPAARRAIEAVSGIPRALWTQATTDRRATA